MAIVAAADITIIDLSDGIATRTTPPENPSNGLSYLDASTTPATLKTYNSSTGKWENGTMALQESDPNTYQTVQDTQTLTNGWTEPGTSQIDGSKIAENTITNSQIDTNAITENKMNWQTHLIF